MKDKEENDKVCQNPSCDRMERYKDGYCEACYSAYFVGKDTVKHNVKEALRGS